MAIAAASKLRRRLSAARSMRQVTHLRTEPNHVDWSKARHYQREAR